MKVLIFILLTLFVCFVLPCALGIAISAMFGYMSVPGSAGSSSKGCSSHPVRQVTAYTPEVVVGANPSLSSYKYSFKHSFAPTAS